MNDVSLVSHKVVNWVMLCLGDSFVHLSIPTMLVWCLLGTRRLGAKLGCLDGMDNAHVTQDSEVLCIHIEGKIVKNIIISTQLQWILDRSVFS